MSTNRHVTLYAGDDSIEVDVDGQLIGELGRAEDDPKDVLRCLAIALGASVATIDGARSQGPR